MSYGSDTFNVTTNGYRLTVNHPSDKATKKLRIFMFGGSTIASRLVEIIEAEGLIK